MSLPPSAPTSPLFEVRDTLNSGRGIFAIQNIPANTPLLKTDGPAASVILREYRKEVCAQCFAYDSGREWKLRDNSTGFAFCSEACEAAWHSRQDATVAAEEAWQAIEKLSKGHSEEDIELDDADAPKPLKPDIALAWKAVEMQASLIRAARKTSTSGDAPSKPARKAVRHALAPRPNPDVLSFLLSGILCKVSAPDAWEAVLALANNPRPYRSAADLAAHVAAYLQLLAVLPGPLLPHVTPDTCITIPARDSHNSFGIRSLEDDGSEFLGYGIWPVASYFNHSCAPNVEKRRVGRCWEFVAAREVWVGEELCITYQSGEDHLSRGQRKDALKRNWGFECCCEKCME